MDLGDLFSGTSEATGRARKVFGILGFVVGVTVGAGLTYSVATSIGSAIIGGLVGGFFCALFAVAFAGHIIAFQLAAMVYIVVLVYRFYFPG